MYLIVCGNVTTEQVMSAAEPYLSGYTYSAPSEYSSCESEPLYVASEYVEKKMQVSKPLFSIGFKDNSIPDDEESRYRKDAGMAILNEMLFSRATDIYASLYDRGIISSPNLSYGYTISQTFAYNFISGELYTP